MKKLFSLLTAVLLSAGMVVQAQLLDAVNDSPEGGYLFDDNGQVSGRNNAPQAYNFSFPTFGGWSDYGTSSSKRSALYKWHTGASGTNPVIGLVVCFNNSNGVTSGTRVYPPKGNYTFGTSYSTGYVFTYRVYVTSAEGYKYSYWKNSSGTMFYPASGTVTFGEGGGETPYVTCNSMGVENGYGQNVGSVSFEAGVAPTYRTVSVTSDNTTMGTVSSAYKSGYFYTPTQNWKEGSTWTLTASPKSGYRFVCWKKNGSQISTTAQTDVVIEGNANYIAYFESDAYVASNGIITAVSNNNTLGAVSGTAGSNAFVSGTLYTAGTNISLSATPEDGCYFLQWSDGNTSNPRSFSVDGNVNITAQFYAKTQYTKHYNWSDAGTNGVQDWNSSDDNANSIRWSTYILYQFQLCSNWSGTINASNPAASLSFCIDFQNDGYWTYDSGVNAPGIGTYPVNTTATSLNAVYKNTLICNPNYVNMYNASAGQAQNKSFYIADSRLFFTSGAAVIEFGRHGSPYLYTQNLQNETAMFDITVGAGRNLTTTYNSSVTVAKAEDYNRVVLYASDGTNNLNLLFNVASIDDKIYIPEGEYTVGTDVWGGCHDADGYSDWRLTGGTITISKNGNALSMTTSSLTAIDNDDQAQNLNLTINNQTPTKKTITNIAVGSASVNKYSGYFNMIGSNSSYSVRIESASIDYRTGYYDQEELEMNSSYTYISGLTLDYTRQQALVSEVGGKTFMEAYEWTTSGDVYRIGMFQGAYAITYKDQGNAAYSGTNTASLPTSHIYGNNTTLVDGEKTGATFEGWYDNQACTGDAVATIGATDKTANFTLYAKWTVNTHKVTVNVSPSGYGTVRVGSGSEQSSVEVTSIPYNTAYSSSSNVLTIGSTIATITATAANPDPDDGYTYSFSNWSSASGNTPDEDLTLTANFTRSVTTYTITYEDLNGASNSNTTSYTKFTETFDLADPGMREGYTFTGWTCGGEAITEIALGSTGDKTITANWEAVSYDNLTLLDDEDATYYNWFKNTYNGHEVGEVTYARAFEADKWYTLCLPFSVPASDVAPLTVYDFKSATGDAEEGHTVEMHFRTLGGNAMLEAGKGYMVKASMDAEDGLNFFDVNIDTDADTGDEIWTLDGAKDEGDIAIVGTLRKGVLETGNSSYMGIKNTNEGAKIYYAGNGATVRAYRAFFKIDSPTPVAPRVRIVVEDEQATPIEVIEMDGEGNLMPVSGDEVRKYIEDGVLIIERNGKRYNAVGAEL